MNDNFENERIQIYFERLKETFEMGSVREK